MTKVAVLWSHISGYLSASLRALRNCDCEIFLAACEPDARAPFHKGTVAWLGDDHIYWRPGGRTDENSLTKALREFQPDIILCSGWGNSAYLDVCRKFAGSAVRVLCFDTPWQNTPRQHLGRLWSRVKLVPHFEKVFVPGERQYQTAMMLGFEVHKVIFGLLCPDTELFSSFDPSPPLEKKSFLYVGRLASEKGVAQLAAAYVAYWQRISEPWELKVAGTGPLSSLLANLPGVKMLGFVQPSELPTVLAGSSCLVVPSLYEAWGVQISEGATAGLPIIATQECGASVHLVRENFNGFLVPAGDVECLCNAMLRMSASDQLATFARHSQWLSWQYTPEIFAANLLQACAGLLNHRPSQGAS